MPDIVACIPFVNRPDLLIRAMQSLHASVTTNPNVHGVIIHNGAAHLTPTLHDWCNRFGWHLFTPIVPLTFAQTQNAMQAIVRTMQADGLLWAHHDMEATPEAVARVLAAATRSNIVFSHYDVLCWYGVEAMDRVGPWDTAIPWYYSDNDWYWRARLAEVPVAEVSGEGVAHVTGASATIQSDWRLAIATHAQTQRSQDVYIAKWGGLPGAERYPLPYDGQRLIPSVALLTRGPLHQALISTYESDEGMLLTRQSPRSAAAQTRALAWAYDLAGRPARIAETGTAKALFAYLLTWLIDKPTHLLTCDPDPRSRAAVALVQGATDLLTIEPHTAPSREVWTADRLQGVGLAWIDGAHDAASAAHDLTTAMAAGVPVLAVDDTRMPEVRAALDAALAAFPAYRELAHPWAADDERQLVIVRRT